MKMYKSLFGVLAGFAVLFALCEVWANICLTKGSFAGMVEYAFVVLVIWLIVNRFASDPHGVFSRYEVWFAMLFCLLFHLTIVYLAPTAMGQHGQPWDSMTSCKALSMGGIAYRHYPNEVYWINYEVLLTTLGCLFSPTAVTGQWLNAVCCALTIFPMFKISDLVAGRRVTRLVMLLVILSPALAIYSTALVGDFVAAMFATYALFFVLKMFETPQMTRSSFVHVLFAGICLSLFNTFKSIHFLLFFGVLAALTFMLVRGYEWRKSAKFLVKIVVVLFVVMATSSVVNDVIHAVVRIPPAKQKFLDGVVYELILGLNLETRGCWNRPLATSIRPMDLGDKLKLLGAAIKRDKRAYPGLVKDKFKTQYGTHKSGSSFCDWFVISTCDDPYAKQGRRHCPPWVWLWADNGYLLFSAILVLGALGFCFLVKESLSALLPGIIAWVVVLGFVIMSLCIEGHGRYKCVAYPFFFLTMPYVVGLRVPIQKAGAYLAAKCETARRKIATKFQSAGK